MAFQLVASARLPTPWAEFTLHGFRDPASGAEHVALALGAIDGAQPVLCRLHSECLTGDAFHSLRCDCGPQLELALQKIAEDGRGVLLYLRQEGRGIGLVEKIRAYALQDGGADTVEANVRLGHRADARRYDFCGELLQLLGVRAVRLLTNNPAKLAALADAGISIVERVALQPRANAHNRGYLRTKAGKLGHLLDLA
jgi:GTP cyclohydrolase II